MSYNRKVHTDTRTIVDDKGEEINQKIVDVDVLVKDEEEWAWIFSKFLQMALNLDGNEIKVFLYCSLKAELNTNEIILNKSRKAAINEYTATYEGKGDKRKLIKKGLSEGSVSNAIGKLVKKELLIRVGSSGSGTYKVSALFSWRGSMKQRNRELKLNLNVKQAEDFKENQTIGELEPSTLF